MVVNDLVLRTHPAPCPSCGHCPTCGCGGHYCQPGAIPCWPVPPIYNPNWNVYPYSYPDWGGVSSAHTSGNVFVGGDK
jgi:hypothetical protein